MIWKTVKLGEVATVIAGQSPAGENYNKDGVGTPFMQGKKDYGDKFPNPPTVWTTIVTKLAEKGDILMSVRAPVGALNIANQQVCIGRGLAAIRASEKIELDYLFYALLQISARLEGSSGAIFNSINKKQIEEIEFLLPPLAEQQRIVAKLDTAFAEIDKAILNIVGKERNAEKIYLNGIDAHFKETSAAIKTSKLLEVTSKIGSGATPKGGKAAYKTEGISLIRSMNVHDMQFKWKDLAKIDNAQADRLSNVEICKNDVLLNITGASVARCCVVEEAALPARVNQHVAIIRPLEDTVLPNYLAYLLVSKTYKDLLLSVGEGGGATRQAITKAEIEQFRISYPPSIDEQASIVRKFDNLRDQAFQLKAIYTKQIKNFQSLKSAILAEELQSEAA